MAFKQERLEKLIEKEISRIIFQEVKDDRLRFVTITNAKLTGDLSIATVYFTVLGDEEQRKATVQNMEEAKGFIRGQLGKVLEIRKIPELKFKYDESLEYGEKIEKILKEIKKP